jgi:hypothetical protein
MAPDVHAGDARLARTERRQAGEHTDQSRLACAVRPEQSEEFPLFDGHVDVINSDERAKAPRCLAHFDRWIHRLGPFFVKTT